MQVRRPSVDSLLRTPRVRESEFDAQVRATREANITAVRSKATADALAFIGSEPADAAGPLKDAAAGADADAASEADAASATP
jgi:hypothetical protein